MKSCREVAVAGPDTASNQDWVKHFTQDVPKEIVLATSHYYPLGPPADPRMTIDRLLHPGAGFDTLCRQALDSARLLVCRFAWRKGIPATTLENRASAIRLLPPCGRETSACKWRPWVAWE